VSSYWEFQRARRRRFGQEEIVRLYKKRWPKEERPKKGRIQVFPIRRSPDVKIRTAYGDWIAILRKNGWEGRPVMEVFQEVPAIPTR